MRQEKATNLYSVLAIVTAIFEKEGLAHWATAGTLLGAVRHKVRSASFGVIDIDY